MPLGLTESQHADLGRLIAESDRIERGPLPGKHPEIYPGFARVILLGDTDPTYQPRNSRECGVFRRSKEGSQKTVEMVGLNLEGDLVLTIDGVEYQVPCDATTAELREILGLKLRDCRATVFHGLWEFDFNGGRWSEEPPPFDILPFEPPEDDTETPVYDGGLILTDEGWCTATDDGDTVKTITVEDWMPFLTGSVKAGSIGGVTWSHEAGWLPIAWQCREISFKSDGY